MTKTNIFFSILKAVPLSARKASGVSAAATSGDGVSPFLQLPHFSEGVVKKIGRKVCLHINCNIVTPNQTVIWI